MAGLLRFRMGPAEERRRLVWVGVGAILACLLTPYGPETLVRPLRYAFDSTSPFRNIGEWRAPFAPGGIRSPVFPYAIGVWALSIIGLAAFARDRLRSPAVWGAVLVSALTLAMSLKSRRFVPFFSIAQALVVGPVVAALLHSLLTTGRVSPRRRRASQVAEDGSRRTRWVALAVLLPVVAGAILLPKLLRYPLDSRAFLHLTALDGFPVDTFDFIAANELTGPIYNYYNWGGYASLRTDGTLQTYIDGRAGTVYSDEDFRAYQIVLGGQGQNWIRLVEQTEALYFLWPLRRPHWRTLVATGRWRIIHQDSVSALLARNDRVPRQSWNGLPDGPYRFLARGSLLAGSKRLDEAEVMLERAHDALPNMGRACYELALTRFRKGEIEEARATMRECQETFPHRGRAEAWKSNTGFDP